MEVKTITPNTPATVQTGKTMTEEFLSGYYEFRHNLLSDKFEMREKPKTDETSASAWRPVTRESINSLSLHMKREIDDKGWKSAIEECIYSESTPVHDPIAAYLNSLPAWDGQDRVHALFSRLPEINEQQHRWLHSWLRSAVAHWLQMDQLHGNEQVLTLIGAQGVKKSTFCAMLLPPELRCYYLDHVNLGNKFDKEMALSHNLVVNIDELDQIKSCQQAELKQMLTKAKVNGRPIFGRVQRDRLRYASFTATTNQPRPLKDPTGSRRYLCVRIPEGSVINLDGDIDYDQLYAQVVNEVREQRIPYWLSTEEQREVEVFNRQFQHLSDLESMVSTCFRHPNAQESVKPMLTSEVVRLLAKSYPDVKVSHGTTVKVGRLLRALNYEQRNTAQGSAFDIVPITAAA